MLKKKKQIAGFAKKSQCFMRHKLKFNFLKILNATYFLKNIIFITMQKSYVKKKLTY